MTNFIYPEKGWKTEAIFIQLACDIAETRFLHKLGITVHDFTIWRTRDDHKTISILTLNIK